MKTRNHQWIFAILGAALVAGCDMRPDEEAISRVMPVTRPPEAFEDDPNEINDRSPVDAVHSPQQLAELQVAEQNDNAGLAQQSGQERIAAKPNADRAIPTSTVVEVEDAEANEVQTNSASQPNAGPANTAVTTTTPQQQAPTNQQQRNRAEQHGESGQGKLGQAVQHAVVALQAVGDSGVKGTIYLDETNEGLRVHGKVSGLTPGKHGFHIHQYGDLTDQQAGESAGGHYDPRGMPHGERDAEERHIGDFGNIEAGQDGVASVDFTDRVASLNGENNVLGRAIVVHAGEDKFSQPSGDAGPRVAFGVIGVRKSDSSQPK